MNNKVTIKMNLELSLSNDISSLIEYHEEMLEKNLNNMSKESLSKEKDIHEVLKAFDLMEKAYNLK